MGTNPLASHVTTVQTVQPTGVKQAPTVEDRLSALETRATTNENNHQVLLKKLRKKLAFFDK
jgi:hypothetical protein